jgi:hypothetical protein
MVWISHLNVQLSHTRQNTERHSFHMGTWRICKSLHQETSMCLQCGWCHSCLLVSTISTEVSSPHMFHLGNFLSRSYSIVSSINRSFDERNHSNENKCNLNSFKCLYDANVLLAISSIWLATLSFLVLSNTFSFKISLPNKSLKQKMSNSIIVLLSDVLRDGELSKVK